MLAKAARTAAADFFLKNAVLIELESDLLSGLFYMYHVSISCKCLDHTLTMGKHGWSEHAITQLQRTLCHG